MLDPPSPTLLYPLPIMAAAAIWRRVPGDHLAGPRGQLIQRQSQQAVPSPTD